MMTDDQVQVIDRVREYLRVQLSDFSKEKSEKMAVHYFIRNAGTRTVYPDGKGYSVNEVTGEHAAHLVKLAKEDRCAWEAAKKLAGILLKENRLECPELRLFAADVLLDKFPKPTTKSAWANISKDFPIALAVYMLERDAGIPPYRNDETEHRNNGLEIVARMVTGLGFSLNPRNCKGIWERWGDHIKYVKKEGPFYFLSDDNDLHFRKSNVPK